MQYKLQRFLLKSIYNIIKGGVIPLLFFITLPLYSDGKINFTYIYPPDLVINIKPNIASGKAYLFWESPADGEYTLRYNHNTEKTALKNIKCNSGEEVKFYITANSITTATGQKSILDLPDGSYIFNLNVTSTSGNTIYSTSFTLTVDGTPPHKPTGLTAIPGDKGVELEWDAPPPSDSDIENYFIYYSKFPEVVSQITGKKEVTTLSIKGDLTSYYIDNLQNGITYHFVIRAKDRADNYSPYSNEATATPRETYSLADFTGEEGGCFIATATYGNINNPLVIIFRLFRDNILKKFSLGKKFIRFYYQESPHYVPYLLHYPLVRYVSLLVLTLLAIVVLIPVVLTINPVVTLAATITFISLFGGKSN